MIVGISGAAGSGKSTVGDALIEKLRYDHGSFAATLKQLLADLFGWPVEQFEDSEWKEQPNDRCYGLTPRQVLQSFGTEWGRKQVHPNIWADAAMNSVANEDTVFTDVRFPNEARAIREAGGIVMFVECRNRATTTELTGHESEAWLPWLKMYADFSIAADFGQLDQLREAAVQTVINYRRGDTPRFVGVSQEMRDQLGRLEEEINDRFE